MNQIEKPLRGRGAHLNPANRFEELHIEQDHDVWDEEPQKVRTRFFIDDTRTILAKNDSPDIPFTCSVNPYRGCEHGCAYCYARPYHAYLGFSSGVDFESRIMVKTKAPELLRQALSKPTWQPQSVSMSGVTDCYQPCERKFQLSRQLLEVFLDFRNPVGIVTKNRLVTRDIDLLAKLARQHCTAVFLSITTLDTALARSMEPRTSPPPARLEALRMLSEAGVPTGVMTAPIIPGLNDHEIPAILDAAAKAGARAAGYVMLRLPLEVKPIFEEWLARKFPEHSEKILRRIASIRDGKANDARFGTRMTGEGPLAEQVRQLFQIATRRSGLNRERLPLSTSHFRNAEDKQMQLL